MRELIVYILDGLLNWLRPKEPTYERRYLAPVLSWIDTPGPLRITRGEQTYVLRDDMWFLVYWELGYSSLEMFEGLESELEWCEYEALPLYSDDGPYGYAKVKKTEKISEIT